MKNLFPQRKSATISFLERAVLHFDCEIAIQNLERCMKTSGINATGLMLVGETGLGKTTCVRLFKEKFSPPDSETHSFKPVVVTVTPAGATEKGLLSALLKTLGCPRPDRGSSVSMYQRAIDLIEILETRIIIFDEIQHLSERNALKKTLPVVNLIKNIMTETNCPIVLVGMPDSIDLLNEKQLDRRFMKSLTLKPFSMSDTPVTNDFTESDVYFSFLNTITSILPIETINLLDPNVARRLLAASSGKIAILIKIFEALIENNDGHVATLNDFSLAFHDIADHDAKHCPFLISTAKLESMYF